MSNRTESAGHKVRPSQFAGLQREERYDAIIVGGGHNGLVCANYLAKRGMDVLVLEKRDIVGGACVTERPWPEYPEVKVSTTSYVCSLFDNQIIRDFDLKSYGFKLLEKNPQSFTPFANGEYLFLYNDSAETKREIARISPKDAEAYEKYEKDISKIARALEPLMKKPLPDIDNLGEVVTFGAKNLRHLPRLAMNAKKLMDLGLISVEDFLDRWFESPILKASLATDGIVGAMAAPSTPGTAYVLMHHVIGGAEGSSWGYMEGGMGAITQALRGSAERYGVRFETGVAVDRIIVENGAVKGVATVEGREYRANTIVSNADPKVTFLSLVDQKELPEEFLKRVKEFKTEGASFKLNLLLSGLPNFRFGDNPGNSIGPQHMGSIYMCEDMAYMGRAFADAKYYGVTSRNPVVSMTIPSTVDRTLAPEGMHVAGCFVQYAPLELSNTTWEAEKPRFIESIISTIERYAPNIRSILLATHGLSPLDLQNEYSLTGGSIFHGDITPTQMLRRFQPETPIEGLYLCGSGTHPGGGVSGLPGFNAAKLIRS